MLAFILRRLGQDATDEQRREITRALGLDRPFYIQYLHFLGNAVQGEFGLSLVPAITITGLQLGAIIAFAYYMVDPRLRLRPT